MKKLIQLSLLLAVAIVVSACGAYESTTPERVEEKDGERPVLLGEKVSSGNFEGRSDHVTKGTATIRKADGGGFLLHLEDDFDFDGAPAPKWGFGKGEIDKKTIFADLKANKGKQTYKIPASIDIRSHNEVWLWCEKFDVPLGVAKLN